MPLKAISPDSAGLDGGTTAQLYGTGFTNLKSVKFGSQTGTGLTIQSDTKAIVVVPPAAIKRDNQVALVLNFGAGPVTYPAKFCYYDLTQLVGLQAFLDGLDVSRFIISWGSLEQVREMLLATPQVFTSEVTLQLHNFNNFLSPAGPTSTIQGMNFFNSELEIRVYGETIFKGLIIDVPVTIDTYTAEIKARSIFNILGTRIFTGTGTATNPGDLLTAIVNTAIPETKTTTGNARDLSPYVDYRSLTAAGAPAREAGATIKYEFTGNDTCLTAIQKISEVCSIEVFLYGFRLTARPYRPLASNVNIKAELLDDFVKEWQRIESAYLTFYNRVTMGYPTDQAVVLNDLASQRTNNAVQDLTYSDTDQIACNDQESAVFFGNLFLQRNAKRRAKVSVLGKGDFYQFTIGDRVTITQPMAGYDKKPFEIIEVHRDLDNRGYQLALAEL